MRQLNLFLGLLGQQLLRELVAEVNQKFLMSCLDELIARSKKLAS